MRYKDSVEDRVHDLLSSRLENIYSVFGQIPDVLEDAWVEMARCERAAAQRIIDEVPVKHLFELKYSRVETVTWETCSEVLFDGIRVSRLVSGW